jgi:hypothetical protein
LFFVDIIIPQGSDLRNVQVRYFFNPLGLFWMEPNGRKVQPSFFAVFRRFSWQFAGYGQNGFFGKIAIY